jgi:hypothetical protein
MRSISVFLSLLVIILLLSSFGRKICSQCKTIYSLTDTTFLKNKSKDYIVKTMIKLFSKTTLVPCWHSNASLDFGQPTYPSYSLKKSLFKLDLMRLLLYYRCSDKYIKKLKNIQGGNFTADENKILNNRILTNSIRTQDSIYIQEIDSFYNYEQTKNYFKSQGIDREKDYYIDTLILH